MFDRIFANYLVETGKLSEQNVEVILSTKEERRARLGVIAVAENVLTVEQAEEINQLQALYDKRFGDIAIDSGYLTKEQVERLLNLQGNAFLTFVQAVIDHGCLTLDEINQALATYQKKNSLTGGDMENLKSCEIDDIVSIFLFKQPELLIDLCGIFVRAIYRLVDYRVYIKKPYVSTELPYHYLGMQELFGEHNILTAIIGDSETLRQAAIGFAGAEYIETDSDSLDALCELINCINGMFATKKSREGMDLDMKVPEFSLEPGTFRGALLCIPVIVYDREFTVIFSIDNEFSK